MHVPPTATNTAADPNGLAAVAACLVAIAKSLVRIFVVAIEEKKSATLTPRPCGHHPDC